MLSCAPGIRIGLVNVIMCGLIQVIICLNIISRTNELILYVIVIELTVA